MNKYLLVLLQNQVKTIEEYSKIITYLFEDIDELKKEIKELKK